MSFDGTRNVRFSDELLRVLFTRDHAGRRLSVSWGEPDEEGFYTPTITRTDDGHVIVPRAEHDDLLAALEEVMGFVEHSRDSRIVQAIYRTPQDSMRLAADRIDQQDRAIEKARAILALLRGESA